VADPPWPEVGGGKIKRGADRHYPVMSVSEIAALGSEVQKIALPDSHLYLWITNNYLLTAGPAVLAAWGFKYITTITWEKERQGLGQ
jgi:N6-adenosine-specific RNA methylase IME4